MKKISKNLDIDESFQKKERSKARVMRNSQWWKRKRSTGICHYCGNKFPPKELTMDHIVPIARGGRSVKSNIVPCCKECNTKKRQCLPLEWNDYMRAISKF